MIHSLSYVGVLYVKPIPLDINLLNKQLGGKITKNNLFFEEFKISRNGRIEVHANSEGVACSKLRKLMEKVQSFLEIRFAGIGTYNSDGTLQAFFPKISDAADFLGEIALEILLELGLSEDSAEAQAAVIANEILCAMIRKGKVVNQGMSALGLRHFSENSGIIMVDENLRDSMLDTYAKIVREKKVVADEGHIQVQRLIKSVKQKKDDLFYGLAAALIVESIVRLIVYLAESAHSEHGVCGIPSSLQKYLKNETISATELGNEMKTGEPQALMILNSLELLGILRVADESLRTFKKTGRTSIPNVLGEFISMRGETAVMSTTFHEALQKEIEPLEKKRMQIERKTMNKLYKTFLEKNAQL